MMSTASYTTQDRDILRGLAEEVAELADHPREAEKVKLWKKLNALEPERPLVYLMQIPWAEFEDDIPELQLQCTDTNCQRIERDLRRQLFTARKLPSDIVIENVWRVPKAIKGADKNFGMPVEREEHIGYAQSFTPIISDESDIEKIRWPEVRHDEDETARRVAFAEDLFGDILHVQACGVRELFFKAWDWIVRRTGVSEALMDMMLRPDYMHALIGRLTEVNLARIDQLEAAGLLDASPPCPELSPGPAGYADELPQPDADPAQYRAMDLWGGDSPQIFGEVSPEMHMEFGLNYENQVMARCGLNYYGCCEPLHNKMDILATVPRLRKVSISPWCDVSEALANARQTYVFSHKPTPAGLARDHFDIKAAEDDLRERLRDSGPMPCEFTMKDISTIRGDVQRLIDWCNMAMRVVNEVEEDG